MSGIAGRGKEFRREHDAMLGMSRAHQRFGAADGKFPQANFRLIPELQPTAVERLDKIDLDLFAVRRRLRRLGRRHRRLQAADEVAASKWLAQRAQHREPMPRPDALNLA